MSTGRPGIRAGLLAIETGLALVLAWVLVFVVPFPRAGRLLGGPRRPAPPAPPAQPEQARARAVARRVVRLADRLPWSSTCLVRAVAGRLLLARRGIPSTIRLGVRKQSGALAAHAWLLAGDTTLLGGEVAADYVPLADLGGPA